MTIEQWPRKLKGVSIFAGLAVAAPYGIEIVAYGEPCQVICQNLHFGVREWADLPHTDPPTYPSPISERDLSYEITGTTRTMSWSSAWPGVGSSGTFEIMLP